jgi:hypothetical protein
LVVSSSSSTSSPRSTVTPRPGGTRRRSHGDGRRQTDPASPAEQKAREISSPATTVHLYLPSGDARQPPHMPMNLAPTTACSVSARGGVQRAAVLKGAEIPACLRLVPPGGFRR